MSKFQMSKFHKQATFGYIEKAIRDAERQGRQQDYVERAGQALSNSEAIEAIIAMRYDGLALIPCCDHVDASGRCLGIG